jgi:hypothetical protein
MFFDSKECTYKDIALLIAGSSTKKARGIKYGSSMDKELLHGQAGEILSIQEGDRNYSGELTVLRGVLKDMNDAARTAGGKDILDMELDIVVKYRAAGSRQLELRTLAGLQFTSFDEEWLQGSKFAEIKLPFIFQDLI